MMEYRDEYKGTIVDVDDPQGLGRARVRVKGLFDEIPDTYLPWASPKSRETSVKGGSSGILVKGQKTWVRFLEGDVNFPVFRGGVIETKDDLPKNNDAKRAIIYESPNKDIVIAVSEDLEDIEIKTKNYNTTLGTIIDLLLSHTHMTPTGVSGNAGSGIPPVLSANLNTGKLV